MAFVDLQVHCLNGTVVHFKDVATQMLGRELRRWISNDLPAKPGGTLCLAYQDQPLVMDQTLLQQGISDAVALSCTYMATDVCRAWSFLRGMGFTCETADVLEGLTLVGLPAIHYLKYAPRTLQTLVLNDNEPLQEVVKWPADLRSLTLGRSYDQPLQGVRLPGTLQSLTLGDSFNQSLRGLSWPSSLQSLTLGNLYNQDWDLEGVCFPETLNTLTFGDQFNRKLEAVCFPAGLKTLTFGRDFNRSLERAAFPEGLESMTFGRNFNHALPVILPSALRSLKLGLEFNHSLDGVKIPRHLQSLTLGDGFKQSLACVLLQSSWVVVSKMFCFECSLQSLALGYHLPANLEKVLRMKSLRSLSFGVGFNQSVKLPPLKTLIFGHDFNQNMEGTNLPADLQSLTFGCLFNQSLENLKWPEGLKSLTLGKAFNRSLKKVCFPRGLQSLTFGAKFNQSLEKVMLPLGLQSLTFGHCFNQSLEAVRLPKQLSTLTFGASFQCSLEDSLGVHLKDVHLKDEVDLPESLQTLTLGESFNQSLSGVAVPPSLQALICTGGFFWVDGCVALPRSLKTVSCHGITVSTEGSNEDGGVPGFVWQGRKRDEGRQGVKKKLPLQTIQCLIEYLNPQLEVLCVEKEVTDQQEVLRFLKATTLVGILPVPHPIVIRTYQASPYTAMWFTSYMWGVIFTRSQRMPLYDWKKIRLVKDSEDQTSPRFWIMFGGSLMVINPCS
eukprot:s918_g16.t1